MHRFFDRNPGTVATALVGKVLQIGETKATIMSVLPQGSSDNATWIERRPLFGNQPVDAYVAPYRGSHMLFLRTGAKDTCVRIDGISIEGETYASPGKVCKALGINSERNGRVKFNGKVVSVSWP